MADTTSTSDALYERDGDRLIPMPVTGGPWSTESQHGGAVAAILAHTVESVPAPVSAQVVRLTIELLRPVPIRPLVAEVEVVRPGRKVQIIEARLIADGVDVAWARGLRIRADPVAVPTVPADLASPPLPDHTRRSSGPTFRVPFAGAFEMCFVRGSWDEPGPVTMWTRLTLPVLAGEDPTPLQRTAAAADFGNGVSRILDFSTHVFINPDLTVSLSRPPVGEWIGFDVVTRLSALGYGQAESLVFDPAGPVGRAVQSLIVEER